MSSRLEEIGREIINKFNKNTSDIEVEKVRLFITNSNSNTRMNYELYDYKSSSWYERDEIFMNHVTYRGRYNDFTLELFKIVNRLIDAYNRENGSSINRLDCEFSKESFKVI